MELPKTTHQGNSYNRNPIVHPQGLQKTHTQPSTRYIHTVTVRYSEFKYPGRCNASIEEP